MSRQKEKYSRTHFLCQLSAAISRPIGSNQKEKEVVLKKIGYNVDLWEISKLSSGIYVFRINVTDLEGTENEVEGKLVVN